MADCEGISMATSFKLCTYLMSSIIGKRIASPWRRKKQNNNNWDTFIYYNNTLQY